MIQLWNRFQADAAEKLYAATGKRTPIVLWTSRLTEKATLFFFSWIWICIFFVKYQNSKIFQLSLKKDCSCNCIWGEKDGEK